MHTHMRLNQHHLCIECLPINTLIVLLLLVFTFVTKISLIFQVHIWIESEAINNICRCYHFVEANSIPSIPKLCLNSLLCYAAIQRR